MADDAGEIAAACHDMAVRLRSGGTLVVFGYGAASTDSQHVFFERPGLLTPEVVS
ncbi:MAG: hypothetical protein ACRDRT_01510 [Pseudonocardiaceae bacterium]